MRRINRWFVYLYLILVMAVPKPASAQFAFQIEITSPQSGEAVQGLIPIIGTSAVNGFESNILEFSATDSQPVSWFVISKSEIPIENNLLGEWDTNSLTDDTYRLRLIVRRTAEEPVIVFVEGVRVRNYTPVETNTPGPSATPIPGQTAAPTETMIPATPTPLPDNQIELSNSKIRFSFIAGVLSALSFFIFLGLYTAARRKSRL